MKPLTEAQYQLLLIVCLAGGAAVAGGFEHWRHTNREAEIQAIDFAAQQTALAVQKDVLSGKYSTLEIGPTQATVGTERTRRLPDGTIVKVDSLPDTGLYRLPDGTLRAVINGRDVAECHEVAK